MDTNQPQLETPVTAEPRCYRHPDRVTYVACGHCGKPLCPDCMVHGPVGVRCRDCLYPQGRGGHLIQPERIAGAVRLAAILAVVWAVVMVAVGPLVYHPSIPGFPNYDYIVGAEDYAPNFLLSLLAGCTVGCVFWLRCGRVWNSVTRRWAILLGGGAPLLAGLVAVAVTHVQFPIFLPANLLFDLRLLAAVGVNVLFAWLISTQRSGI